MARRGRLPARFRAHAATLPAPIMRRAALVFFLQWLSATIAGVAIEHFAPSPDTTAQFLSLLIASMATFVCAVIAAVELLKYTLAGRAVALGLVWVNVAVSALVVWYTGHWLFVAAHALFALAFMRLTRVEGSRRGGTIGVVAASLLMLVPAGYYATLRTRGHAQLDAAEQAGDESARTESWRAARATFARLDALAAVVGETPERRAVWRANVGLLMAHLGDTVKGYETVRSALRFDDPPTAYRAKAHVYCLMTGVAYRARVERELTEPERARVRIWDSQDALSDEALQAILDELHAMERWRESWIEANPDDARYADRIAEAAATELTRYRTETRQRDVYREIQRQADIAILSGYIAAARTLYASVRDRYPGTIVADAAAWELSRLGGAAASENR